MKRILVTGASGLLGLNLAFHAAGRYQVLGITHQHALVGVPFEALSLDLSVQGALDPVFERFQPEAVVHCAAQANIDAAERDPQKAWRLNADLPGEIALASSRWGARLVHLSTDSVFDGARGDYTEEDSPHPLSVYAQSKLGGEQAVARVYPPAVIARVNFFGWSLNGQRSLAEFFYHNLSAGRRVNGFTDVIFCPLFVNHLADTLLEMLEKGLSGLFHTVSRESLSKYEFGVKIARQFGLDEHLITPVSVADGNLVARRSPNLSLRVEKLERVLGHAMPGINAGIAELYLQHQAGYARRLSACHRQG